MADVSTCPTCPTVQAVCFWGPLKVAAWKRPTLLALSALVVAGLLALAVFSLATTRATWQWFLLVPMLGLGILGLVVALRGCPDCVARISGSI